VKNESIGSDSIEMSETGIKRIQPMKPVLLAPALVILLSSCAFVPRVSDNQIYANKCQMHTRHLTLGAEDLGALNCGSSGNNESAEACMIAFGVVVPVSTFIVSGSIVVAGNTLHWLEYQGSCEGSDLSRGIKRLKLSLNKNKNQPDDSYSEEPNGEE
jgi:hypothetical protein